MAKLTVKVESNLPKLKKAFEEQIELALAAIGHTAERHAKEESPVDTGRLRNSITWATKNQQGGGTEDSLPRATPEEHTVYVGTNVEYAVYVEYNEKASHEPPKYGGGKAHFLRDAAANHNEEYKEIMKAYLSSK